MQPVLYDGSFDGLLTTIFEVYEYKIKVPLIQRDGMASGSLFEAPHRVITNPEKAGRVFSKLDQLLSRGAMKQLYSTFLSELPGIDDTLLRYVQYVLTSKFGVENDYGHPDVLMVQQTAKKVHRERHRMEAFVRFQLTKDQLYYAVIQPDFNVLPLIAQHFKNRYADQRWMLYDGRRKYGLYYDLKEVSEITIDFKEDSSSDAVFDQDENLYQELWKQYFQSINIAARKNTRLHVQHMPKRYWKFLTEKQVR